MSKSWENAKDHVGEKFEENAKTKSTVEFSSAAAAGEPFHAKSNPNAKSKA